MSDLIDRQAAIDAARKCSVKKVTPDYMLVDKAEIMTELMMLPSAQEEIKRCRDCVYGRPVEGDEEHRVDCAHGIAAWEGTYVHGVNWYCADAERRENETCGCGCADTHDEICNNR